MDASVVLKSTIGETEIRVALPNGQYLVKKFEAKNDFNCEIPTKVTYVDPLHKDQVKVAIDNLAQHLLDTKPWLKVVKVNEATAIEEPKKKLGRPRKEPQDETVS